LGATQRLSKPYWPLLNRTIRSTKDIPKFPLRSLGQGFQDLLAFGINVDVASVLQAIGDLTTVIDCHCRGIKHISNLTILIDRRNLIQHRLMSLPKGDELNYGEVSSVCLYESIRNATIIFSVAVTFPLPPLMGIFRKLASVLKEILEESKFDPCWQLCPKTLLWILILGGIAALGTIERTWYVQNLVAISAALGLSNWEEVSDELDNYLWLNSACEAGGRMLWLEVMNDRVLQECDKASFPSV
jgi:hypothetical protein